jgi:hypothetical protein
MSIAVLFADGLAPPQTMETAMRKIFVFGLTTLVFALSSIDADAATDNQKTHHAAMHRRAVAAASVVPTPLSGAVGEAFSAHYSSGEDRQVPAFSRVSNPNECAPDKAEPSWGPGAILLGYNCNHGENGN